MRSKIFLYLFVFAALIGLYIFISSQNRVKDSEKEIEHLKLNVAELEASNEDLQLQVMDMQYFSLENNDDALVYYDHLNLDDPSGYIADKLLETNEMRGNNPLIPYEGMENDFKINKIKILNHRWIVTDFSDGKYWGELLIKYELKDDLAVDFTVVEHLLYARSN